MEHPNLTCEYCKQSATNDQDKCPSCGFPIKGTDMQKEIFYHQLESKKWDLKDLDQKIHNARLTLWIIAGLTFLFAIINYFSHSDNDEAILLLILNIVIAIVFLLISSWAKEKPFSALILGLVAYVGLNLYFIMEGRQELNFAAIGKLIIVALLVKGIISAREAEEMKKEVDKAKR
jgi:uncharacterized membrane protein